MVGMTGPVALTPNIRSAAGLNTMMR